MNEVMNSVNNAIMDKFQKTDNIINDVQTIITTTDIDLIDSDLVSKSKIFNVCNGTMVADGKKVCKNG